MSESEIDTEIAVHLTTVDQLKSVAKSLDPSLASTTIIHELFDLADRVLTAWQLDRDRLLNRNDVE